MASSALFRALLLASSLGWNGVFAQDQYHQNSTWSSAPTAFAPQIEESHASLGVPAASTTTTPTTSKITSPPIAYSPARGHSEPSLDIPSSSQHVVPMIPVLGQSGSSLDLPTSSPAPSSFSTARTAWDVPIIAYSQSSLDVPKTTTAHLNATSSSTPVIFAPSPVLQHTQTSLDVPDKPTQVGHDGGKGDGSSRHTSWVEATPVIGVSESSLLVPDSTSTFTTTPSWTWRRPNTEQTQPSLHVPGRPTGDGSHHGQDDEPGQTYTGPSLLSPATGYSQTQLSVPPTTNIVAPSPATAISQTELQIPTRHPGGGNNGLVATISLPLENSHGYGNGRPVHHGQHNNANNDDQEAQQDNLPNPGGIIASIAHEQGQGWQGQQGGQDQNQNQDQDQNQHNGAIVEPLTTTEQPRGSTYHIAGTQIVAGASAATVDGTTYSLAPSGKGIFVNGQMTEFSGPAATDSVAMAVMSALGGGETENGTGTGRPSSTIATTTMASELVLAGQSSSGGGVAQQTGNAGAKRDVLSGLGLGGLGMVVALL